MHPAGAFQAGREAALRIARAHPFAAVGVAAGAGLAGLQTPLIPVFGADGEVAAFEGHFARANRAYEALAGRDAAPALAVFSGPDAYVSPSSYASKADGGRVVPTWNYVSAEAEGTLTLVEDAAATRAILDRQAAVYEAGQVEPWATAHAPADYIAALLRAIVGLRLDVTRFEATEKLSQNKAGADFDGVLRALEARGELGARGVAARMRELERG